MKVLKRGTKQRDFPDGLSERSGHVVRGHHVERKFEGPLAAKKKGKKGEVFLKPQGSVNNHISFKEEQKVAPVRNANQSTP